jgi:hypothetical protein
VALKIVFFVLWIPVAVAAAYLVFRLARRETGVLSVAVLTGAIALACLVVFPRTIKDTAAAAHRFERHWSANEHRAGGPQDCLTANFHACVRERVWAELRQLIPEHNRYYLQTDYGLIHFWTFTSLLPRIAVENVREADWVISYRADPKALGVGFSERHTIRHVYANGSYSMVVGKVRR